MTDLGIEMQSFCLFMLGMFVVLCLYVELGGD